MASTRIAACWTSVGGAISAQHKREHISGDAVKVSCQLPSQPMAVGPHVFLDTSWGSSRLFPTDL